MFNIFIKLSIMNSGLFFNIRKRLFQFFINMLYETLYSPFILANKEKFFIY